MKRRGIHFSIKGEEDCRQVERFITGLAPSLGLTDIIVETGLAFKSHPEVSRPGEMSAADARGLAKVCREHGVNLIPLCQSLGHQSFRDKPGALLKTHPEFNEAPDMGMNSFKFDNFYSWCPNHPGVNPLVFDLYDEMLDAFESKSLHVGMDEVFVLGECPRCKGTPNAKLFAKAVNDFHGHIVKKRGARMLMWGDRLLPPETGFSMWERSNNQTERAIDLIPRDIVICDWHYEVMPGDDYPSVRYIQEKGHPAWPAGWNVPQAVQRLIEVSRRDDKGLLEGYLCTTWIPASQVIARLFDEPVEKPNEHLEKVVECIRLACGLMKLLVRAS